MLNRQQRAVRKLRKNRTVPIKGPKPRKGRHGYKGLNIFKEKKVY